MILAILLIGQHLVELFIDELRLVLELDLVIIETGQSSLSGATIDVGFFFHFPPQEHSPCVITFRFGLGIVSLLFELVVNALDCHIFLVQLLVRRLELAERLHPVFADLLQLLVLLFELLARCIIFDVLLVHNVCIVMPVRLHLFFEFELINYKTPDHLTIF